MKELIAMVKESAESSDGFLNGFIKGVVLSSAIIVALVFLSGYTV